ncbi:MAG: hypothetical protein Q8N05_16665 [Bacteroidota bacterium]|nr:hypothetical protein [Bacteroidota bacterium]
MKKKLLPNQLSQGQQKAKVSCDNYEIFINGMFNPVSPLFYNYLTGWEDGKVTAPLKALETHNNSARVNGIAHFNN